MAAKSRGLGKGIDSMIPVGNSDKQSVKMKESKLKIKKRQQKQ